MMNKSFQKPLDVITSCGQSKALIPNQNRPFWVVHGNGSDVAFACLRQVDHHWLRSSLKIEKTITKTTYLTSTRHFALSKYRGVSL